MLRPSIQRAKQLAKLGANLALRAVRRDACPACGKGVLFWRRDVLWPELIAEWRLTPQWVDHFNRREGDHCVVCLASLRDRHLATAIAVEIRRRTGATGRSLRTVCRHPDAARIDVAEINACGLLHPHLASLPGLRYSEYGSKRAEVPHEDLTHLSYPDDSFDLVLTSETLEHVPDFDACNREIARVLRPGGRHIFTIPVVWDRPETLRRATIENGQLRHLVAPSYHLGKGGRRDDDFLVFNEFGADIVDRLRGLGFTVVLDQFAGNPAVVNLLATVTKSG